MRKLFFIMVWFLCPQIGFSAALTDIQLTGNSSSATLVVDFSSRVPVNHFFLDNPKRLVFDFSNVSKHPENPKVKSVSALVSGIRLGQQNNDHTRLVLDITKSLDLALLRQTTEKRFRLTVKLKALTRQAIKTVTVATRPSTPVPQIKRKVPPRDVIVMIDPGHGGKDPGATGRRGVREKAVVLAIAKRLQRLVNLTPGMKAVLTRRADYYIGLRQRLKLARKNKADIFISIHADAFKDSAPRGVSVFTLSPRGATSEAARWLAEKENYSELGGVDLSELNDDNNLVRSVLIDLSQTATIDASLKLGEELLKYLDDLTKLHHDEVEQARFVVLKSPDIPSVLIETGFISNVKEEQLLKSPWYQNKLAQKIINGLKHYFSEYPPRDSYFERMRREYRVVRGDSLSTIASRFRVRQSTIKSFNHLKSSKIFIGQKLIIPEQ